MQAQRTPLQEARPYVDRFFHMDPSLIGRFHARAGDGISACLDYEMDQIEAEGSEFYVVKEESEEAALFGFSRFDAGIASLQFFMVNPKYRHTKPIEEIWNEVWANNKDGKFLVGIRERNKPAIKFYERMKGLYLFNTKDPKDPEQQVRLYYFEKGLTWQL